MNRAVVLFPRFVAACVFLLLVAGALVTSTESGLAVPDWPLSYGQLMPPMVGGILYEHGHRMIAAAVSTLVGLQVAVMFLGRAPRRLKLLALLAFGAILAQALLGGLTVLFLLPPAVSSAHAGLAQVVFALTASIALLATPSGPTSPTSHTSPASAPLRGAVERAFRLAVLATGAIYVQIILGAVVRHTGAGLAIPDWPLSFGRLLPSLAHLAEKGVPMQTAHRLGAYTVAVLVVLALRSLWGLGAALPAARRAAIAWGALVVVQVLLGATSVWTKKMVVVTTAHLAVGALCWATGVLVSVSLGRLRSSADPAATAVPTAPTAPASAPSPSRLSDLVALTKPRITVFVALTAFVGYAVALKGPLAGADWGLLAALLVGTSLVSSGTSAFNQLVEIDLDRRMARTASRPLPSGRLSPLLAFVIASALSLAGLAILWRFTNPITTFLAFATLTSYVFAYTPLKTRSPLSLVVGAIPGALPPLGGYTALHGSIALPGLVLFAVLFLWQLPHFLAIGWRHRADYGQAGFRILSVLDPTGHRSGREAVLWAALLVPVSLGPVLLGNAGLVYGTATFLLSVFFLWTAERFRRERTDAAALRLFLASIAWLPAVLVLLVANRITS